MRIYGELWTQCHDEVYTAKEGCFVFRTDGDPELAKYITDLHNSKVQAQQQDEEQ